MIGYKLEETVNGEVIKKPWLFTNIVKTVLLASYVLLTANCSLFNKTDPKEVVTIDNEVPIEGTYNDKKVGDTQSFKFDSNSKLGLPLTEFYRVNGARVDNDSEYEHTFDKKGVTTIEGVAKTKEDSAKVTWMYTIDNQSPTANDKAVTMDEETTKKIPQTDLGSDPDGDNLSYNVTSTSNGLNASFENGELKITGEQDYFGNANVNYYSVNDGEASANGTVNVTINNVADDPVANAGEDKQGTINEEITLDGTASNHPDTPLSNIVNYEWKALNDEGNVQITDSDQENAKLNANTRGQYQIELTITDDKNAVDKDTVNISVDSYKIIGNISELFNEGVNIAGANVNFGENNTTTDASGNYSLELKIGTNDARLIINHPDFYERQTSSFAPTDTTLNETMVEDEFNMEHYDLITRYVDQGTSPGTQRWVTAPTVYIDTSAAPNGGTQTGTTTPITQANIDMALEVIADLPQFAKGLFPGDTVNVEIGTNPPAWGTEKYIVFSWSNTISGNGEHGEFVSSNEIYSALTRIRTTAARGTYLQELTQNMGARNDSEIVTPSVLNAPHGGDFYFQVDLDTGNLLYSRKPGNLFPDKDK